MNTKDIANSTVLIFFSVVESLPRGLRDCYQDHHGASKINLRPEKDAKRTD